MALTTGSAAGTGAVIGAISGACLGCPGGPPGALAGAGIGAGVGFVVGGAIGFGVVTYDYYKWKKTDEGKRCGGEISAFLSHDPLLKQCLCSKTSEIAMDPVRTPDGALYERSEIEDWIQKNGTDPKTNKPLKKDDLKEAPEVANLVCKSMIKLLEEDIDMLKKNNCDPGFIKGMEKLKEQALQQRSFNYKKDLDKIELERKNGTITSSDAEKMIAEKFLSYYGDKAENFK